VHFVERVNNLRSRNAQVPNDFRSALFLVVDLADDEINDLLNMFFDLGC